MTETDTATTAATGGTSPASDPTQPRKRRRGSIILRWVGGVLGALVVALIIFLALFNWDWFRPPLAKMLAARLHRPVKIAGHLRVHLLTGPRR